MTSKADLEALRAREDVTVLGVFPGGASGAAFEAFMAAASAARDDYVFGHAGSADVLPDGEAAPAAAAVIVYKNFDEGRAETAELGSADALREWLDANAAPRVVELGQDPKFKNALRKLFAKPVAKARARAPPRPAYPPSASRWRRVERHPFVT